jgi:hypothetical protein
MASWTRICAAQGRALRCPLDNGAWAAGMRDGKPPVCK